MASAVKRLCSESLICSYARPIQPKSYVRRRWCRSVSTTLARPRLPFDDSNRRLQNRSNGGSTELDSRQAISGGRLMSSYKRRGGVSSPQPWEDNRGLEFVPDNEMDDIEEEEPEDKSKLGFWAEGEEEMGPDEEFHGDDISALGHGELERHRELREYARIAAWELPLLSNLAKPFEPPQKNQVLRFRYTTYLGEQHAAANKVVVEFCPSDIPDLSPQQQAKLIKLCGTRYNPSTEIVKMSCEMFDSQMQNRRYLSDVANALVKEAKDPADTFEDVPFDFRHHKPKQRFEFPEEWLLTPERKRQLEMRRNESLDQDRKRIQQGTVVDGRAAIESSAGAARALEPEMVLASPTQRPTQRRAR